MGRKLVLWVLGYAWLVLLAGVGLLAAMAYFAWSAGHGGGIPTQDKLTTAQGHAIAAREMTVERRRRRGGKSTEKFFEIDLKTAAGGEPLKLRVSHDIPREKMEEALDEDLRVKYDADDHNLTYVIDYQDGRPIVSYQELAALAQRRADANSAFFSGGGMIAAALSWIAIGAALMWLRRRMLAKDRAHAAAEAQPALAPGGSMIGADLPKA